MDIWLLRSPLELMRKNTTIDFMLALHQDNPYTVNVGIYYIRGRPHNAFFFQIVHRCGGSARERE